MLESKFLKDLKKSQGERTIIGFNMAPEVADDNWFSTGSKMLDMQMNGGKLNLGGVPGGKISVFAGPKTCGKTYFASQVIKDFLEKEPLGIALYYDTEEAMTPARLFNSGISKENIERCIIVPIVTQEELWLKVAEAYRNIETENVRIMIVVDSVGGLSSQAAFNDIEIGNIPKASMGREQKMNKEIAKYIMHKANSGNHGPCILISHVYKDLNAPNPKYATNVISGGEGIGYFNSNTVIFTRSKYKEEKDSSIHEVNGILVRSIITKSRLAREETITQSLIHFNRGVIPYFGFVSMLEQAGFLWKAGNKYQLDGPNPDYVKNSKKPNERYPGLGPTYWAKELNANASLIQEPLKKLEPWTIKQFAIGKLSMSTNDESLEVPESTLDFSRVDEDEISSTGK